MKLASLKQPFLKQVYTKPVDSVFREALIGVVSAIHHAALFWILHKSFPYFFSDKETLWCRLSSGLVYSKPVIHWKLLELRLAEKINTREMSFINVLGCMKCFLTIK